MARVVEEIHRTVGKPERVAIPADRVDAALAAGLDVSLSLDLRPLRAEDYGYARWSFAEGHKGAPGVSSMTWRYYKRFIAPELERALTFPTTEILGAYLGGTVAGWLAFARGKRVSTVHWVHVRFQLGDGGMELRRRGVMTALLDAADLGDRIAYTFKGSAPKHRKDGKTMDERLLPWLQRRGQHAAYVPWEQWIL
jgi:hypothetical protein